DVICDLSCNLPFANNTFDLVFASHVLEHITNLDDMLGETSRVLKPKGKLQVSLPYAGSLRAFQDPTHVRFFTLKTFEYFISEGSSVGTWYMPQYFRRITRRQLTFGNNPLSTIMALLVNRNQKLL